MCLNIFRARCGSRTHIDLCIISRFCFCSTPTLTPNHHPDIEEIVSFAHSLLFHHLAYCPIRYLDQKINSSWRFHCHQIIVSKASIHHTIGEQKRINLLGTLPLMASVDGLLNRGRFTCEICRYRITSSGAGTFTKKSNDHSYSAWIESSGSFHLTQWASGNNCIEVCQDFKSTATDKV